MSVQMTRRHLLSLVAAAASTTLLAACAPAQQPAAPSKPTEAPKPAETKPAAPAATSAPAAAAPAATAAPVAPAKPAASSGGRIIIAYDSETPTLDPSLATTADFRQINSYMYDSLVQMDLTNEQGQPPLKPGLASEWSVGADGKTWTFKLRNGVKFHDGTDFDASAVKQMFDRLTDKNSKFYSEKGAALNRLTGFQNVTETKVVDPRTVEVTLNQINPEFPRLMSLPSAGVVSPASREKYPEAEIGDHPVGTGPFVFSRWQRGQDLVLTRNPNYWGDAPQVEELVIRVIPDPNTRATALLTNEVQFVHNIPPGALAERMRRDSSVKILSTGGPNVVFWHLNSKSGPTADKRVRQALNYAIDRDALVKQLGGLAEPARGYYPPGNAAYTADLKGYTYDPARAKQLLAEAGHSGGFSFAMNVPSGTGGWPPEGVDAWQLIQAQLKEVGVQVSLNVMDGSAYSTDVTPGLKDDAPAGVTWIITGADLISMTNTLLATSSQPPNGTNRGWYSNAAIDALFGDIAKETDLDKRVALYRKVDQLAVEDASALFLYYKKVARGVRANVSGIYAPASAFYTLNMAKIG